MLVIAVSPFMLAALCPAASAQAGEWVWMSGSSGVGGNGGPSGIYGGLGVAAGSNVPGGRWGANSWIDNSGKLWLFGGAGVDSVGDQGDLNDLWAFNPSTQEWTWMSGSSTIGSNGGQSGVYGVLGVAAASNVPGGRYQAVSWGDSSGNFWFFGGAGYDSTADAGDLNDLWKFDPIAGEWTWMGGSSTSGINGGQPGVYGTLGVAAAGNIPGGRYAANGWVDGSGNVWIFGGYGFDSTGSQGELNDLWEFNPGTLQWAWMGGSNTVGSNGGQSGVYGVLGTAAAGNVPGGRQNALTWSDSSGNLWMFGGYGFDSTGDEDDLNDVWKFTPANAEWTWMGGSGTAGQAGVYGKLGSAARGNISGGRDSAVSWLDSSGNLWLFGGYGYDSTDAGGYLNDLWEFNISTTEWAWMGGNSTVGNNGGRDGVYGTLGSGAANNNPGGRLAAVSWTDDSGNYWLFGGQGFDSVGAYGDLNDLWKYQFTVPTAAEPVFAPGAGSFSGDFDVTITDSTVGATIYYTTDGSTPTKASNVYSVPVAVAVSETIKAIAVAAGYSNSYVAAATYMIEPTTVSTPIFSPGAGTYATAQSVTISDTTPGATIYYTTDGSTPTTSSNVYNGAITVIVPETIEAMAAASGYLNSAIATATYTIAQPTPSLGSVSPVEISANTAFTLTVSGTQFTQDSIIYMGSTALATQDVSATELTAQVTAAQVANANNYAITVETPGGGSSNPIYFAVVNPDISASSATLTIAPAAASVTAGSTATFAVTFNNAVTAGVSSCSNLPIGAACTYQSSTNSQAAGTLTITTSTLTPKGTYQLTLNCNEIVPAAASAAEGMLLPFLPLSLLLLRKKMRAHGLGQMVCAGAVLFALTIFQAGCAAGGPSIGGGTTSVTSPATNVGAVMLTVQ
jgi:N-acetylneuraminic acid mutarotase